MNIRIFKNKLNEKGVGLIGVMVAAALVVVAAFTVANFVTDQWRQSMKLEISGSCQNIANSIVEYIKKDETSLLISSYGIRNVAPYPSNTATDAISYPQGLDSTDDGVDRFRFLTGTPINLYNSSGGNPLTSVSGRTVLSNTWSFNNHLNIKNSSNRLIALAASGNYCCANLNMNDPNCGAEFYSDTMPRPGFTITDRNVDVTLAVNIPNNAGGSLCTGQTLLTSNIPDSRHSAPIDFKVRVVINRDQDNQKICDATGRVQRNVDVDPAMTLLQYQTNFCTGTNTTPGVCGASGDVVIIAKTVKEADPAANTCRTACIEGIHSRQCPDITAGSLSLFDSINHASCTANCADSEPGSAFLCKIGEKSWFDANNGLDVWQPCETATVRDSDGSNIVGADVLIDYDPVINDANQSERTTRARITLRGLLSNRGYVADIRSIDTAGNVGPSFCQYSDSCASPLPHFVIVSAPPAPTAIVDTTTHVTTVAGPQLGRVSNSTAVPALANFNGNYQCQAGTPSFQTSTGSVGNYVTDTCQATYVDAANVSSNPYCPCANGVCTVVLPGPVNQNGNHRIEMLISNVCGTAPAPATLNWCNDNIAGIGITTNALGTMGSVPSLASYINYPTTGTGGAKACGLLTMCPELTGPPDPRIRNNNAGGTCGTPATWNAQTHSGCIADPTNNLCISVYDPCGRVQNTSTVAPSPEGQYATYLAVGSGTTNECYSIGGAPVSGNFCEPPAGGVPVCDRSGKCVTSYPPPRNCNNDEDCVDNRYGATWNEPDGPKCVGTLCTTGTNKEAPAVAGSCGNHYCPELNSCGINIGNSVDGGGSCTPCNQWVQTWPGTCTQVSPGVYQETSTVTCPLGNCCFAAPPVQTRGCPSCGTAAGVATGTQPTTNLCASGTSGPVSDTGPGWEWSCTEATPAPPRTVDCTAPKPPPGCWVRAVLYDEGCGTPGSLPACPTIGSSCSPIGDSLACNCRTGGASTGNSEFECRSCGPSPINGTCGVANGTNRSAAPPADELCTSGNPSAITGTGPWSWSCQGIDGGTTSSCSANTNACAPPVGTPGAITVTDVTFCAAEYSMTSMPVGANPNSTSSGGGAGSRWQCRRGSFLGTFNSSPALDYYYIRIQYNYMGVPGQVEHYDRTYSVGFSQCVFNSTGTFGPGDCDTTARSGSAPPGTPYRIYSHAFRPDSSPPPFGPAYLRFDAAIYNDNPCPAVVNGACGTSNGGSFPSAPTTNLCSAGTASAVTGTGPWSWTCNGSGGGTNASCSAAQDIGMCEWEALSTPVFGCHVCSPPSLFGSCSTPGLVAGGTGIGYGCECPSRCRCEGLCGPASGNSYANASAVNAAGLCSSGAATPASVTGAGPWNWTCSGLGGGTNVSCSATLIPACKCGRIFYGLGYYVPVGGYGGTPYPSLGACESGLPAQHVCIEHCEGGLGGCGCWRRIDLWAAPLPSDLQCAKDPPKDYLAYNDSHLSVE